MLLNFAHAAALSTRRPSLRHSESGKLRRYVHRLPGVNALLLLQGRHRMPHPRGHPLRNRRTTSAVSSDRAQKLPAYGNVRNAVNLPNCELRQKRQLPHYPLPPQHPQLVGQITAILAADNINIEHMVNNSRGEYAYTIIDIEPPVGEEGLEKLKAIKGMVRVRVIG